LIVYLDACIRLKIVQFHVFGNFPETAWRVFKAARQLMRNRLTVRAWPRGDTCMPT